MTGYSTTINAGYGQGAYVVSASSEYDTQVPAWKVFDKSASSWWASSPTYTTGVAYSGSVATSDVNGSSYKGEWLQVQMPSSLILSSYQISPQSGPVNTPGTWYVLGSRDGINWLLLDQRTVVSSVWTGVSYNTYQVQSSAAFTYFRIVFFTVSINNSAALQEWVLNGTIESVNITADGRVGLGVVAPVQALEVAGSGVFAGTVSAGTGLMFRNRIINGNFDVWQRGTSFNPASGGYMADRWRTTFDGTGATRTVSQQSFPLGQVDVPGNPKYFMRFNQSVAGSGGGYNTLEQGIEGVSTFAGMIVTASFWARVGSGSQNISSVFAQIFGTGGSPSATTFSTYSPNFTLSATWQRFTYSTILPSITNKTLGTTNDNVILYFWLPTNTTFIIDISQVQVEQGIVATPFEFRPYTVELQLCQRYYFRPSFSPTVVRALFTTVMEYAGGTSAFVSMDSIYYPIMRTSPTISYINIQYSNYWVRPGQNSFTSNSITGLSFRIVGPNTIEMSQSYNAGGTTPSFGNVYYWEASFALDINAEL
jgi:hypothetical protein